MAIKPPSDIVLDVARSADPARLNGAVKRLAEAGSTTASPADFAADLAALGADKLGPGFGDIRTRLQALTQGTSEIAAKAQKTAKQFEAVLLQKSIEAMLPNSAKIYGRGNAGGIWKSMLSQELANQLVNRGGIGLAPHIAHYIEKKAAAANATNVGEVGVTQKTDGT